MNIFITGGTGGLGRQIAKAYLKEGHRIGVCGDTLAVFKEVFADAKNIEYFTVDVTDRKQICTAIKQFSGEKLDLVVACAGIAENAQDKSGKMDFDRVNTIIDVNLSGVINTFEAALEIMLPQKSGHLVAISSVAGLAGMPGTPAYSTSKAAVNAFCESLAIRLNPDNIHVTSLLPGFIDTPLARGTQENLDQQPFVLSPEEAAKFCIKAITRKKTRYIFPIQMRMVATLFSFIPKTIYVKLYQHFMKDPRSEQND